MNANTTRRTTTRRTKRPRTVTQTLTWGGTKRLMERFGALPRLGRLLLALPAAAVLVTILLVLPWRWIAPPTSAFMLRESFTTAKVVYRHWISWNRISPQLPIAVVAAEDQKFPQHAGFDFESIAEALQDHRRRPRGASTISQQVAKNLYLWPGRSYLRKGLEAYLTVWIELLWPKRRILEVYLNSAEFGPGIFGVGAAAERLFGKSAARLTRYESALLAAVLPNPKRMSAGRPSAYVRERAREIVREISQLGGPAYLAGI
jgi:monofunctional biosynthetic peptidoglycan transglycosylase